MSQIFSLLEMGGGVQHSAVVCILASTPSYPGIDLRLRSFFQEKISDITVLIDSTLLIQWTAKSLIKLIEHIQNWLMASWYCKKDPKKSVSISLGEQKLSKNSEYHTNLNSKWPIFFD